LDCVTDLRGRIGGGVVFWGLIDTSDVFGVMLRGGNRFGGGGPVFCGRMGSDGALFCTLAECGGVIFRGRIGSDGAIFCTLAEGGGVIFCARAGGAGAIFCVRGGGGGGACCARETGGGGGGA
jgi:hypothetical protein